MLSTPAAKIIYFYTELNPKIREIGTYPKVELRKDFGPDVIEDHVDGSHLWILVDDHILKPVYRDLADIFCIKSRSRNVSITILSQNLFSRAAPESSKFYREILINTTISILFCNKQDRTIVTSLAKTAFPNRYHYFVESYHKACELDSSGHGYLCIRTAPGVPKKLELTTKIFFQTEHTVLFWERK